MLNFLLFGIRNDDYTIVKQLKKTLFYIVFFIAALPILTYLLIQEQYNLNEIFLLLSSLILLGCFVVHHNFFGFFFLIYVPVFLWLNLIGLGEEQVVISVSFFLLVLIFYFIYFQLFLFIIEINSNAMKNKEVAILSNSNYSKIILRSLFRSILPAITGLIVVAIKRTGSIALLFAILGIFILCWIGLYFYIASASQNHRNRNHSFH